MVTTLANHLWQSTLFALAVALLAGAWRHDAARIRYGLWLAASVKFLVPFSALAALGARLAPPNESITLGIAWPVTFERLAEPVSGAGSSPLWSALLAIWALGAVVVLVHWLLAAKRLATLVRHARESGRPDATPLPVKWSSSRIEPALVGIWRPVLLLPEDVAKHLTPAQLDAVIAHELCHLERRDNVTGAAHMLVEALFWFHPLVWWIGSRLVEERERACDEAVIGAGHDRRAYAEAILSVAELRVASPLKCAAGVGGFSLKGRIEFVMRSKAMKKLDLHKKVLVNVGAISALAVPLASGWLATSGTALAQQELELPIVKVAPVYPEAAVEEGLEGFVLLEFAVTKEGAVKNPIVIESSNKIFEQPSIDAALKFKYAPATLNDQPVEVAYVRNKFSFVLESSNDGAAVQLRERNDTGER